jgi:long-chain acyl-CoA synthetase
LLEQLRVADDSGVVLFTSGSSGIPKAALQSVERFLHKFDRPGRGLRTLAFLLLDHIAGLDTLFHTLANGGTLVTTRNRSPRAICEVIAAARVAVLPASPSFLRLLSLASDDTVADLSSLEVITYGSEPMNQGTLDWLNSRFPKLQIMQKYGTTETGAPRTQSRDNGSLWIQLGGNGIESRVIDDVLYLRGAGTILGYLNAPGPFDTDGWFCTGDLVERDGPWIRVRGRSSDIINVGGAKVFPIEVEQTILELGFVSEVVVVGEPNPMLGQIVVARAVLNGALESRAAVQQIRAHCRSRLASYKIPVKIDIVQGGLVSERHKLQRSAV